MINHILSKNKVIATLFLIFVFQTMFGVGHVPVINYTRERYHGGSQNWAAAQDKLGRMYFGNRYGMMRYDGHHWRTYYLPNFSTVRSLLFDEPSGRIYVGGSEEFGYFAANAAGTDLEYFSLSENIDNCPVFTEVWNIMKTGDAVFFQSDFHIFTFADNKISVARSDSRISKTSLIGETLYLALDNGEIQKFGDSGFEKLPGAESLRGKRIAAILDAPTPGKLMIVTSVDGLYIFDGATIQPLSSDINDFLKASQVFCASSDGPNYFFGTVNRGAVLKNFSTGESEYLNSQSGMQNNTVLNAFFDRLGNVWMLLDNGIDYGVFNSPISYLIGSQNTIGAGYAFKRRGNKVYFGTNQGLYSSSYPFRSSPNPLELRRELSGQIWSITEDGDNLFVGCDAGAYYINNGHISKIEGLSGTHMIRPLRYNPNLALASTYSRFHLLRREGDKWADLGPIGGYDGNGARFIEDKEGYIWISHWRKGLYRMLLNPATKRFDQCILINSNHGLPTNENNSISDIDGQVVISSGNKYFTFDNEHLKIKEEPALDSIFPNSNTGSIFALGTRTISINDAVINIRAPHPISGEYSTDSITFRPLASKLIPGFVSIELADSDEMIVTTQDGFVYIPQNYRKAPAETPEPFVNTIYANHDSIAYTAPLLSSEKSEIELPYSLNILKLELGCSTYEPGNPIEFSTMLEGYDDTWTPFSRESLREFSHLPEGKYTLRIKAANLLTGAVGESDFKISILPPWYRSLPAKIVYWILAALSLCALAALMLKWNKHLQSKERARAEKKLQELKQTSEKEAMRREYEIATLKSEQLEQDILHRSQELKGTTMNLVRKNEMLQEISEMLDRLQKLTDQKADDATLRKHISKIKKQIENNLSQDSDMEAIYKNFDIVYEDFLHRLMEKHASLTPTDKRMCCYIKMGLSSKDVAPLMNISPKSVEMARYRLRKKLGIDSEVSLYDYLLSI